MKSPVLPCLLFLVFLASCGEAPPEETFTPPPVGILDAGDHRITLHSTPESPVYSIEDREGNLLARHLSREDFASQFPELFQEINSLWAGNERQTLREDPMKRAVFEDLLETEPLLPRPVRP